MEIGWVCRCRTASGISTPTEPATRAGCDVGLVATANAVLENTGPDVPKVFGVNSPEAAAALADPAQAQADFVGLAIHCAQSSDICTPARGGKPDLLPDEPNGYIGYMGLFGHKSVAYRPSLARCFFSRL